MVVIARSEVKANRACPERSDESIMITHVGGMDSSVAALPLNDTDWVLR